MLQRLARLVIDRIDPRWVQRIAVACLLAGGVLWLGLVVVLLQTFPVAAAVIQRGGTPTPFQPMRVTATPFQPLPTNLQPADLIEQPNGDPFFEGWVQPGDEPVEIRISPQPANWAGSRDIRVRFYPGSECMYGDQHGCASLHQDGRHVLFTVHSGWDGEGEQLRHALEGSGIDRAWLSLEQTRHRQATLVGATVEIHRGNYHLTDWRVAAAVRIPPEEMPAYFAAPFSLALQRLTDQNPHLAGIFESGQRVVFLETCGWRNPQETTSEWISATSGSVYLIAFVPAR